MTSGKNVKLAPLLSYLVGCLANPFFKTVTIKFPDLFNSSPSAASAAQSGQCYKPFFGGNPQN